MWIAASIVVVWLIAFAAMGWWSQRDTASRTGLNDGLLQACPNSPNCVCSDDTQSPSEQHSIAPSPLAGDNDMRIKAVVAAVHAAGGEIKKQSDRYVHATFTSRIFRFVDDVEFRLGDGVVHLRSASRVGHSDIGVNRKRAAALAQLLAREGDS